MDNKKSAKTFINVIIGLLVSAMASVAIASDQKTYPGTICVEDGDTSPNIYYTVDGRAENDEDADNVFICPLMRDEVSASAVADITVYINDQSSDEPVTCYLKRRGLYYQEDISGARSTSGTGIKKLEFLDQSLQYENGYMYISCDMPDKDTYRSGIVSIVVNED